jgi:Transposase DDE domain
VNFHGEKRKNDTHASTTDPDALLCRKGQGKEAKLAYLGHVLLDNRHGLVANVCATAATGTAEREAALELLKPVRRAKTVAGDKNYDVASFVDGVRELEITPHVAQKAQSAIDGRTTRHALRHQPTQTQAGRTGVWLDEDRRRAPQTAASRRRTRGLDRDLHGRRLQPDPAAHAFGEGVVSMDDRQIDCSDGTHYEYERRCDMNAFMNTLDGLRIGSRVTFSSSC